MGVSLSLSASRESSATTSTFTVTVKAVSDYGSYNNDKCSGYITYDGSGKRTFSHAFSANTTTTLATKTKSFDRGHSDKTITIKASFATGVSSGTVTKTKDVTVPAKSKYTVSFNANGGSGAPGSQTKWYGETLTLSSTKPTKSGYTFMGWGTSATDTSVDYASGGGYTANAGDTLYAIWKKNITVTYGGNGGSAASSGETKSVYNATTSAAFTLPSATRSGYTLLGWSTSATSKSATYAAGSSYSFSSNVTLYAIWRKTVTVTFNANGGGSTPGSITGYMYNSEPSVGIKMASAISRPYYNFLGWSTAANATESTYNADTTYNLSSSVTLYAVWKLAYVNPKITNLKVERCLEDNTPDDLGTYVHISFDWACDTNMITSETPITIDISWSSLNTETKTKTINTTGTNGTVDEYIGEGTISSEYNYDISVKVADTTGSSIATVHVNSAKYILDFKNGGKGLSIGKPATKDIFDVAWETNFDKPVKGDGLLNSIYPVGSIYMSMNNISPASFLGGTWTQIKDSFLLAVGSKYETASNKSGGESTHTLTSTEMPGHTHTIPALSGNAASNGAHTHQVGSNTNPYGFTTSDGSTGADTASSISGSGYKYPRAVDSATCARAKNTQSAGAHGHSVTTDQSTTYSTGGGGAHNNMPPYLSVYMWYRTA